MVILRKSRSFLKFFYSVFVYFLFSPFILFVLTFPLYSHIFFFFAASPFLFLLYVCGGGWSCSLETGPRSCLERQNGNERRQVIKIREGSSEMSYPLCRIWFTMIALADTHRWRTGTYNPSCLVSDACHMHWDSGVKVCPPQQRKKTPCCGSCRALGA